MKYRAEYNVHLFNTHKFKKEIQQVGLEYGLFSKTVKIKREVVVVVQNLSKEIPPKHNRRKRQAINIKRHH